MITKVMKDQGSQVKFFFFFFLRKKIQGLIGSFIPIK
jgi:hypothetical protein